MNKKNFKHVKSLKTEIIINAPVAKVWQVLTNFEAYPEWNPFIIKIIGNLEIGHKLEAIIQAEGQSAMTFKPTVLKVEEEKEFRWLGHLFIRGLFDGEHYFELEALGPQQTKLIHGENFSGILVGLLLKRIGDGTLAGFKAMNKALKERVETMQNVKL